MVTELKTIALKFLDRFAEKHGHYLIGTVQLVVLWFLIVKPILDMNRVDYDTNLKVVNAMENTAEALDRCVLRLERLERRP